MSLSKLNLFLVILAHNNFNYLFWGYTTPAPSKISQEKEAHETLNSNSDLWAIDRFGEGVIVFSSIFTDEPLVSKSMDVQITLLNLNGPKTKGLYMKKRSLWLERG